MCTTVANVVIILYFTTIGTVDHNRFSFISNDAEIFERINTCYYWSRN
jgi:hypothetical protein